MDYQLYHGDCLEIMPTLEAGSVDAIIADWPYGTTACPWDSVIPLEPLWKECKRVIKKNGAIVLFGSQPFTSVLVMSNLGWFKYEWIWDKKLPTDFLNAKNKPMKRHENILIFSQATTANGSSNKMLYNLQMWESSPYRKTRKKDPRIGVWERGNRLSFELNPYGSNGERYPVSILEFSNADRVNKLHPTQKPLPLLEYLVKTYTNPGDVVLDNTFGSCTTGEACLRTGRRFIGIEKDDNYFRIGQERLERVKAELGAMLPNFQMIGA